MYQPRPQNNALAATLILIATAFIAATTVMAKSLGTDTLGAPLSAVQISHGRFLFAFIAICSVGVIIRPKLTRPRWRLHIARTSFGWAGVTLMFASVAYIPLADATAISFLNPVFAMMLAIPLLREQVGRVRWSAAILALIGALILLRPTPDSFQPAALLALGAAMIMGFELIFMKKLAGRENPFQILLVNNFIGLCIATCAVLPFWHPPTPAQWVTLAGIGCCMAIAQTCFVNAMARADASFVAPFSYATLIFAAAYDAVIFGVHPDGITYIGAAIILTGALWLALREARLKKPALSTSTSA